MANTRKDVFLHVNMLTGPMCERLGTRCWPFTLATNKDNRPYFRVDGKNLLAYRITYELVHGEGSLDGLVARHKCDNEICCNPHHIEPGTQQDNVRDMQERERHGLPHHVVRAIRKLAAKQVSDTAIGELYGLARNTVNEIVSGVKYKHLPMENGDDAV